MSFSDRSAVGATAGRGSSASAALPEQRSSTGADARFTALAAAAALPQAAWELPQPPAPAPSTAHRPAQNAFAAQPPGAWMLHGAHHPPPPVPSSSSSSFAMFAAPPPLAGSSAPSPHHRPAPPRPAPSPAQSVASFYSASPGSSVVRGPVTCQPCRDSHVACSGTSLPCTRCVKRGRPALCCEAPIVRKGRPLIRAGGEGSDEETKPRKKSAAPKKPRAKPAPVKPEPKPAPYIPSGCMPDEPSPVMLAQPPLIATGSQSETAPTPEDAMAAAWLVGLGGGSNTQPIAAVDASEGRAPINGPSSPAVASSTPAPSSSQRPTSQRASPSVRARQSDDEDSPVERADLEAAPGHAVARKRKTPAGEPDNDPEFTVGRKAPRSSAGAMSRIESAGAMSRVESAAPSEMGAEVGSPLAAADVGVEAERNAAKPKREDYDVPRGQFHRYERIRMDLSVPDPAWPAPPTRSTAPRELDPASVDPVGPPLPPLRAPEWQPMSLLSLPTPADQAPPFPPLPHAPDAFGTVLKTTAAVVAASQQ